MFAFHSSSLQVLPPRCFILPLLILAALLGASLTQAQQVLPSETPTLTSISAWELNDPWPHPTPTTKGKVWLSQNRYDYVRIHWDNIISGLETDLDPIYRVHLGPVGVKGFQRAIIGYWWYEYTAAKGMKPNRNTSSG